SSTIFPYTTLFRSRGYIWEYKGHVVPCIFLALITVISEHSGIDLVLKVDSLLCRVGSVLSRIRSEEHTSELQSRFDLVCSLLLENKNLRLSARRNMCFDMSSIARASGY